MADSSVIQDPKLLTSLECISEANVLFFVLVLILIVVVLLVLAVLPVVLVLFWFILFILFILKILRRMFFGGYFAAAGPGKLEMMNVTFVFFHLPEIFKNVHHLV